MAIGLLFFPANELSEYRISYWRIQETIGLSDIGNQGLNLSDYQISDSEKTIGCPPSVSVWICYTIVSIWNQTIIHGQAMTLVITQPLLQRCFSLSPIEPVILNESILPDSGHWFIWNVWNVNCTYNWPTDSTVVFSSVSVWICYTIVSVWNQPPWPGDDTCNNPTSVAEMFFLVSIWTC